jgi:hypothetical protein
VATSWDDFNGLLLQLGFDKQLINQGPYIPPMPSVLVTFTFTGGAGLLDEGTLDDQNVQMRVRGDANDQSGPEAMARKYDSLLLNAPYPMTIGSTRFHVLDRVGSAPEPLGPPDDGDRFEYVSNYRMVVGL